MRIYQMRGQTNHVVVNKGQNIYTCLEERRFIIDSESPPDDEGVQRVNRLIRNTALAHRCRLNH